jgi:glycosyltransferase 2 family protein
LVLLLAPDALAPLREMLPSFVGQPAAARLTGAGLLAAVLVYVAGSILRLPPLTIFGFRLVYPRPEIVARQLVAAPLELLGAAGIIYFALPEGSPSFVGVLGVFLASFSAALISNAPGGLGVFELVFITAMPSVPQVKVLTALLVFRLLYLIIPLAFSLPFVLLFERQKLKGTTAAPSIADGAERTRTLS